MPYVATAASQIVAVQNIRIKPFDDALNGFQKVYHSNLNQIVISGSKGINIQSEINRINPDMVLAVGSDALTKVKSIESIPIIYFMVLNPQTIISTEKNIAGVSINITPEKQLNNLLEIIPDIKKVGLIYDPERSDNFVNESISAASTMGIEIVSRNTHL